MLKYRGARLARAGFLGVVLAVLVIAVGLQPERLLAYATSLKYQARFTEAGVIAVGNDVTLSGIKVGAVTGVSLVEGDALVGFTVASQYPLGSQTTAHIKTGTLLDERVLRLDSAGDETMNHTDVIPVERTSSPYSLSDAVGELTTSTEGIDTGQLNQSLDTLSTTLNQ